MHLIKLVLKKLNEDFCCFSVIDIGIQNYGDLNVEKHADRFSSFGRNKSSDC